jgi:hypothetical protein
MGGAVIAAVVGVVLAAVAAFAVPAVVSPAPQPVTEALVSYGTS